MAAKAKVQTGAEVEWKWGSSKAKGKVTKVHKDDVERTIKGTKVKREASAQKPAVEIKTAKGDKVLKSTSEIKKSR